MPTSKLQDLRNSRVKSGDLVLLIEPPLNIHKDIWTVARFAYYDENHSLINSFIALPDTIHYFCPPTNYLGVPTPRIQQVPYSVDHTLPASAKRIEIGKEAVLKAFEDNPYMRLYAQFMKGTLPEPNPDH